MGTYVVTGSASGMGREVTTRLQQAGHTVIGVDLRDTDVAADLSTPHGRELAIREVLGRSGGRLDGAVMAAGLGPTPGRGRARMILEVNHCGVVELLEDWRDALAASGSAKVVVFASNSTTATPLVPRRAVRALLDGDLDKAAATVGWFRRAAPTFAYAASKLAVSHWVRRTAVTPQWAGAGIRLNALAPGAILTPLLEKQLATPSEARAIKGFPIPVGHFGDPGRLADWVVFMLGDAADFLCGSIVFVDGGSDAYLRPDDWPRPVPARELPAYVRRMKAFRARRPRS